MSLGRMRTRIVVGVGAWLLGAATATGGSLLAVSLLGQGIVGGTDQQQLTSEAVNRLLAREASEHASASTRPSPSPSRVHHRRRRPSPSPSAQPTGGTLLSSAGGTVVATCGGAGAYLVSWSPQQGYEAGNVVRGPAATTEVVFWSTGESVTMTVTCAAGTPTASTSSRVHEPGDN